MICGLAAAMAAIIAPASAVRGQAPGRVVIAYLFVGNAPAEVSDADASRLTHINYAFANLRDGEVVEGFAADADNFRRLRALRDRHPHLRILVAVGGWTWSGGFSDAALTGASRERFVRSAVAFVERHGLDGLDIDWEYPGLPGNKNVHRPEDKTNFTTLMAALRPRRCRHALRP
jgi:chitinase